MSITREGEAVVLFDGVCNLCNGAVQFIIRRDRGARFRFASLQSDTGRRLLVDRPELYGLDSIVLIENGQLYTQSSAALRIARRLDGPWRASGILLIAPRWLRDPVYRWIARNRYRWFGKQQSCMLPTAEMKGRFLQDDM
jgi:predicted DCC family thiol-disulfide oxidoreductase YuxK